MIYIILPVHNRVTITHIFISHLKQQTFSDFHLILIDDGCTDGTVKMVRSIIPETTVIHGTGHWWWANSLQQGINWIKKQKINANDLVLFINDDVFFGSDFLAQASNFMNERSRSLLLAQRLEPGKNKPEQSGIHADLKKMTFNLAQSAKDINCLSTRGLFLHFQDVLEIGDFRPKLIPHYWSDYEYTIRAIRMGFKGITIPEVAVSDSVPPHNQNSHEETFLYFLTRLFSKKSTNNPLYKMAFIATVAPKKSIPWQIARTCYGASYSIVEKAFFRIRRKARPRRLNQYRQDKDPPE